MSPTKSGGLTLGTLETSEAAKGAKLGCVGSQFVTTYSQLRVESSGGERTVSVTASMSLTRILQDSLGKKLLSRSERTLRPHEALCNT